MISCVTLQFITNYQLVYMMKATTQFVLLERLCDIVI